MSQDADSLNRRVRELVGSLASVIFPAPCRICGELLEDPTRVPLCAPCWSGLSPISGPMCERCGRPLASPVVSDAVTPPLCGMCRKGLYDFDFARSFTLYTPEATNAILLLKYEEVVPLGRLFARRLLTLVQAHKVKLGKLAVDLVIPVPLHPARFRERGHNQAELIARPLARLLGLPCRSNLLIRTRPRPDKLRLTLRERWRSVRGAYATRGGGRVDNLGVLLVDDVMTTGATLDACSRALRRAGASSVAALTVARALPRGEVSP
jgi:ComF family protein